MKKVLSTKTLDKDMLAKAKTFGLQVDCIEVIQTKAVTSKSNAADTFDSLVFTSVNAVKYFFENSAALKAAKGKIIFSISGQTAKALKDMGFTSAYVADDASALAPLIVSNSRIQSLLHPCGNLVLETLEEKLSETGISYKRLPVYETSLLKPVLPNTDYDAIMFYSPSGVASFFENNEPAKNTVCCCIGSTTADALKHITPGVTIILPDKPSPDSMLQALSEYFLSIPKYHA